MKIDNIIMALTNIRRPNTNDKTKIKKTCAYVKTHILRVLEILLHVATRHVYAKNYIICIYSHVLDWLCNKKIIDCVESSKESAFYQAK